MFDKNTMVTQSMVTQLKSLRVDKTMGKAAERTQQAVEELEYLVTYNRSISQAMQCTMQDLLAWPTSLWHIERATCSLYMVE